MQVVIDIECNSLVNPLQIWVVVCKNIDTGELHVFRKPTLDVSEKERLLSLLSQANRLVGHNILGYDLPVLSNLLDFSYPISNICDTLIISKLVNYSREGGHSLESYGEEFNLPKIHFNDFKQYSEDMENYCVRDVEINHRIYNKFYNIISNPSWHSAIDLEHRFQLICNSLTRNGFAFDVRKANKLLLKVQKELDILDKEIYDAFPPRIKLIREIHPRLTQHGTLNRSDFRWVVDGDLTQFNGYPFCRCRWTEFNPSSHKQLVEVLNASGWKPEERTQTHIEYLRSKQTEKLDHFKQYGWKVNEQNLSTLPDTAPAATKTLAKRILLESRRRSLVEWLSLVQDDGRIHGRFQGIGAWTGRMAHQEPNTANIPREYKEDGSIKLLGKELRELWCAPRGRLLVGVDAEGIQLRIFAHYINDPEFTRALVEGKKHDKTDPHSLNQKILGSVCKSRQAAKRFIYALLLGAGLGKLSQILECSERETKEALNRLLSRYSGWKYLREEVFPQDARRGYFLGLDGRQVPIPGETKRDREHLAMSGYLQNGEAIIIKRASLIASERLGNERFSWFFVDIVHDELQSEGPNSFATAKKIAEIKAQAIKEAGEFYKLRCPMAGSFYNEDTKDYTIGTNWYQTH